MQDLNRRN